MNLNLELFVKQMLEDHEIKFSQHFKKLYWIFSKNKVRKIDLSPKCPFILFCLDFENMFKANLHQRFIGTDLPPTKIRFCEWDGSKFEYVCISSPI